MKIESIETIETWHGVLIISCEENEIIILKDNPLFCISAEPQCAGLCLNGGECVAGICSCTTGWSGTLCESKLK